jgi:hypothetical protein
MTTPGSPLFFSFFFPSTWGTKLGTHAEDMADPAIKMALEI